MEEKTAYTLAELSERWSVSMHTLYDMVRTHKLKAFMVGKNYRVSAATVKEIESNDAYAERRIHRPR